VQRNVPNESAANLYSSVRLVENTPESSVHRTKGCFALYRSPASPRSRG